MIAKLRYLGRALAVFPGEIGPLLEKTCTVSRRDTEVEWEFDEDTGKRYSKRRQVTNKIPLYWYADDNGKPVFCAFAGFASDILALLRKKGYDVIEEDRKDHGLGQPDLSKVKGTIWREGQKEVFAKLLAYPRGIVVCPTGWGKTYIIKKLAQVYPNAEIIVTVNSIDIANDLFEGLKYDLGSHLGMIGDGKDRPKRVTIVVSQSLHKAPKDANMVLVDECHSLMTENYVKKLNKFHRAKIFGLTATPDGRSDKGEGFGRAIFGPVIADVTYQEARKAGNIVQIKVRWIKSEIGPDVSKMHDTVEADRLSLWMNEGRNKLIACSVRELEAEVGPEVQILIMVDKTEHAYALGQLLPEYVVVTGEPEPARVKAMLRRGSMVPGQEVCTRKMRAAYKEAFEANELKRAISSKIWQKGVDFRDLAVLVRADGTGSPIDSGQVPGRLSRLGRETDKQYGLLIDFNDVFSGNLSARSAKRLAVYKRNGFDIERR